MEVLPLIKQALGPVAASDAHRKDAGATDLRMMDKYFKTDFHRHYSFTSSQVKRILTIARTL